MSSRTSGQAGDSILPASASSVPELARYEYAESVLVETQAETKHTSMTSCKPVKNKETEENEPTDKLA